MAQTVMITGTGRSYALGYNMVLRYLENGDNVIATVRKESPDYDKDFFDANLDYIAGAVDVTAVGPLRVIQAFYPLLAKREQMALIINISSEAGSISKCYRTNMVDYGMAKAALNMGTMNLVNEFKDNDKINIFCVHPGWIRTNGQPDNPAPLSAYEAAEILRKLFEEKWNDKTGPRFITNKGEAYPF